MPNFNSFLILQKHNHAKMLLNKLYQGTFCCKYRNYEKDFFLISRNCQTHSLTSNNLVITSPGNIIKNKIDELVTKYEQITGMDEVRIAQNRVIEAQDKFLIAQEKRREVIKELTSIQSKLKEVYGELDTTTRGEERYLNLVTKEHKLLKEERKLTSDFNLSEREERDCFTILSSSVKESHEKERAQAERTKYWSVIGSIVGTIIGVVGSSINNEFKMRELRKLVIESASHSQKTAEADKMAAAILTRHESQLSDIINEMKTLNASSNKTPEGETPFSHILFNVDNSKSSNIEMMFEQQKRETRIVLGVAIVVIVLGCLNKFI